MDAKTHMKPLMKHLITATMTVNGRLLDRMRRVNNIVMKTVIKRVHIFSMMLLMLLVMGGFGTKVAAQPKVLSESSVDWVETQYAPSSSKALAKVVWLPSEHGLKPEEKQIAKQLAALGYAVSVLDVFETFFLPPTSSGLSQIDPKVFSAKLEALRRDKPLIIIASNQSAALAFKALKPMQTRYRTGLGVVLINPNMYTETPEPGKTARYRPIAHSVNFPVYVVQAELSPWRWRLPTLQNILSQGGSDVFLQVLPQIRDRFYFRPDASNKERQYSQTFAEDLHKAILRLAPYLSKERLSPETVTTEATSTPVTPEGQPNKVSATETPLNDLASYTGPQMTGLSLVDLEGQRHSLAAYRGQVVLLNFWASWCPPCVHEMPSMARLKTHFKEQPFEILAANLAETPQAIQAFLQTHPVNFPVLLDPTGSAVKDWKVFAYPSSYVIDKQGVIRYALFGGYEWDNSQAREIITALLEESADPNVP